MVCPLSLAAFLGDNTLTKHAGYVFIVEGHPTGLSAGDELHMVYECPALQPLPQRYASLFSTQTDTMRSFFAQQDHMQVFKFILDCLDFLNI